jgi:hypothetical protein
VSTPVCILMPDRWPTKTARVMLDQPPVLEKPVHTCSWLALGAFRNLTYEVIGVNFPAAPKSSSARARANMHHLDEQTLAVMAKTFFSKSSDACALLDETRRTRCNTARSLGCHSVDMIVTGLTLSWIGTGGTLQGTNSFPVGFGLENRKRCAQWAPECHRGLSERCAGEFETTVGGRVSTPGSKCS